jgi:hypothetical protein
MIQVADFGITFCCACQYINWLDQKSFIEEALGIANPTVHFPNLDGILVGPQRRYQGCSTCMEVTNLPSWDALDEATKLLLDSLFDHSDGVENLSLTYYEPESNKPVLKVYFENYERYHLGDNVLNLQTSFSKINWPAIINLININNRFCGLTLQTHGFGRLHFRQP